MSDPEGPRTVRLATLVATQVHQFASAKPVEQEEAIHSQGAVFLRLIERFAHGRPGEADTAQARAARPELVAAIRQVSTAMAGVPLDVDFTGGWEANSWPFKWATPTGAVPTLTPGAATELASLVASATWTDYLLLRLDAASPPWDPPQASGLHGWATAARWAALAVGRPLSRLERFGRGITFRAVCASVSLGANPALKRALEQADPGERERELSGPFIDAMYTRGAALSWSLPPPTAHASVLAEVEHWATALHAVVTATTRGVEHDLQTELLHAQRGRHQAMEILRLDDERLVALEADPAAAIDERLEMEAVLLARLTAQECEVLALDAMGFRGTEIAERLGLTPTAARQRLARAQKAARAARGA